MAIVTLNKSAIKKFIKGDDKKIEETLSLFGTAIERITEKEVEVEVAPNRPDMLSQQGLIRALSSFLKKTKKQYKLNKPGKDCEIKIESSVAGVRPFTACAIIKNLVFNTEKIKEIIDIQEKLHTTIGRNRKKVAVGIYPLEAIKLPITYKAMPPEKIKFIPLEESKEMTGLQIMKNTKTGRDYAHLLQDKKVFPVFVDSSNQVLSMPPIINSNTTGKITSSTKSVFIECSGFDLAILQKVLNILVTTLADIGGIIYQMNLKYGNKTITTPNLSQEKININLKEANKLLGLNLTEKQVKTLLSKMGYEYKAKTAYIPAYRTDILHPVDVYEDIAIAYGYENFKPELPNIASIGAEQEEQVFIKKLTETLTNLGLLETSSYHLTTKANLKNTNITSSLQLENSKTEYSLLRPYLIQNQLKILSENLDSDYPQNIFEVGKVFPNLHEKTNLCISKTPSNFTEIKQILQYLEEMLNIKLEIKETQHPSFIPGRVGKIIHKNKELGIIGEIHPQVLKNWHLKMPASSLEICIDNLR